MKKFMGNVMWISAGALVALVFFKAFTPLQVGVRMTEAAIPFRCEELYKHPPVWKCYDKGNVGRSKEFFLTDATFRQVK